MPLGSVGFERTATGGYFVWFDPTTVNRLRFLRGKCESYSDVIVRLAKGERD